jgi:hypothetical protein
MNGFWFVVFKFLVQESWRKIAESIIIFETRHSGEGRSPENSDIHDLRYMTLPINYLQGDNLKPFSFIQSKGTLHFPKKCFHNFPGKRP